MIELFIPYIFATSIYKEYQKIIMITLYKLYAQGRQQDTNISCHMFFMFLPTPRIVKNARMHLYVVSFRDTDRVHFIIVRGHLFTKVLFLHLIRLQLLLQRRYCAGYPEILRLSAQKSNFVPYQLIHVWHVCNWTCKICIVHTFFPGSRTF